MSRINQEIKIEKTEKKISYLVVASLVGMQNTRDHE